MVRCSVNPAPPVFARDATPDAVRSGEWPDIPMASVRLWDTRTAWLHVEPAQDQWAFEMLDANIDMAMGHGVTDTTLVLWGTPGWAAESLSADDAPWLGPGVSGPAARQCGLGRLRANCGQSVSRSHHCLRDR